jgi:hypothetical protein
MVRKACNELGLEASAKYVSVARRGQNRNYAFHLQK